MAGADDSRYVFFVPYADDDLRDQSIKTGICAPSEDAQFVGVHLVFVEITANLGEEGLIIFGVHRGVICLVRTGNHLEWQNLITARYGGQTRTATEV